MQEGQEITQVIVDLNNRIRTLENKYNLLGERLLVVNQNMIEEYKRLLREMKIINEDLREMRQETMLTQDAMRNMVKEMELFAKKEQVKVLEKYIDLINPMRFVTTEEVESLIIQKSAGVKRGK
ncbi:MAG: hypothetical protein Q8L34_05315 [Candidatus Woesearchaeota archaeon]|nr:hypothetical protein [Candidatus Woesearchaeota archaeon]